MFLFSCDEELVIDGRIGHEIPYLAWRGKEETQYVCTVLYLHYMYLVPSFFNNVCPARMGEPRQRRRRHWYDRKEFVSTLIPIRVLPYKLWVARSYSARVYAMLHHMYYMNGWLSYHSNA